MGMPPTVAARRRPVLRLGSEPGQETAVAEHGGIREIYAALRPRPGEAPGALARRAAALLRAHGAAAVRLDVFGPLDARPAMAEPLRESLDGGDGPVTWVEGNGRRDGGPGIDGIHLVGVAGTRVDTVRLGGRPVGRAFDDGDARHVLLGGVTPPDAARPAPEQARQAYAALEDALDAAGMGFADVARTWLTIDDILGWYGPFNAARTAFYRDRGVFDRLVPASTGIGGRNPAGTALMAAAWAVRPHDGAPPAREVPSPLQGPAPQYGSSFSRAVEIRGPGLVRLLVSGTASIAPGGETARAGDLDGQIGLTMEVVRAILAGRGMGWEDATRCTVYLQDLRGRPRWEAWRKAAAFPPVPGVVLPAFICRDDLLFEIELEALGPA